MSTGKGEDGKLIDGLNVMRELRIDFLSPVDRPAQEGAKALLLKRSESVEDYEKRTFSAEQRKALAESGAALPDGSFPIENKGDLRNAISAFGRSGSKARVARHIKARAKALGATDSLPDEGMLAKLQKDLHEVPAVPTSVSEGHAHVIMLHAPVGETVSARLQIGDSDESIFHDHVYVLRPDGTIEVLQNSGHTHEVDPADLQLAILGLRKSLGDEQFTNQWPDAGQIIKGTEMTDPKKTAKSGEELEATVLDLTERLALNSIIAGFSDLEKSHFSGLEEIDKVDFVTKSAEDRAEDIAEIVKSKEANDPVVYKSTDGDVYRKSDDPRMVRAARKADRAEKRADAAEIAAADSGFSKRADVELAHLPGTTAERAALLKAVNSIEDPGDRDAAMEALKASDKALAGAFKTAGRGSGVGDDADSPDSKLESLVKRYLEKNDGVTEAKAFSKVLETDEGKALYGETQRQ